MCVDNGTPGCLPPLTSSRDSPATAALGTVTCDESLGALMAHLEDLGILDSTVIVFQGDHGVDAKNRVRSLNLPTVIVANPHACMLLEAYSLHQVPVLVLLVLLCNLYTLWTVSFAAL